jgi:flagellar protein FliO/FliZ
MNTASTVSMTIRLVFSMGVVIGLMLIAARIMRKRGMVRRASSKLTDINIVGRRGLGKHASIAVVEINGRQLIVGVTDQQISLLSEHEDEFALERELEHISGLHQGTVQSQRALPSGDASDSARKGLLDTLRDMTVRRV